MKIETLTVSYAQLAAGKQLMVNDDLCIGKEVLQDAIIQTLLSCPFNLSPSNNAILFSCVDNTIGARMIFYGTQVQLNNKIFPCLTGSSLKTHSTFRDLALGIDLLMYTYNNQDYTFFLGAGLSGMSAPIYKKMKYVYLEAPLLSLYINWLPTLQGKGISGIKAKILNKLLQFYTFPQKFKQFQYRKRLQQKFTIQKVDSIPSWVDDIIAQDTHPYKELHNKKWLEWVLHHNFSSNSIDKQSFYIVTYNKQPIGFFLTTERGTYNDKGELSYLSGKLVEWGSFNEKELSEFDINLLAIKTFSNQVAIIYTTSTDQKTLVRLKSYGFAHKNNIANMCFKCNTKEFPGINDINNWRFRLGYGDTIFY